MAGAGGAAHLAGVAAAHTTLPVLGVPMESASLKGLDSLLSTVQMPGGIPVATFAIGKPGAVNAALFAVAILAGKRPELGKKLADFRAEQATKILAGETPVADLSLPLIGLLLGASVASGLRLYATIAVLGFLGRSGALALPAGLTVLTQPVGHRGRGRALPRRVPGRQDPDRRLRLGPRPHVRPGPGRGAARVGGHGGRRREGRIIAALLCGGVALSAHGLKASARVALTRAPSPSPTGSRPSPRTA